MPLWVLLYRNIRALVKDRRIQSLISYLPHDAAWEKQYWDLRTILETQWDVSTVQRIHTFLKRFRYHQFSDIVYKRLFEWLERETEAELYLEPGWTNRMKILYVDYPSKQHTDVILMEEGRDLPSIFFYVMLHQHPTYHSKGYGYLHFIKEVEPFPGTIMMQWVLYVARNLDCTELHLFDQATVSCSGKPLKNGTESIPDLIEFPISLSFLSLLRHRKSWYEQLGFQICSDQTPRKAVYYLPWKRETGSITPIVKKWRTIPDRLDAIRASSLLPAFDRLLRSPPSKINMVEIATVWSPVSAYLRLYLSENRTDTLRAFLLWLHNSNCIVYHAFQEVWIQEALSTPTNVIREVFTLSSLVKTRKFPEFAPLATIVAILSTARYFWTNPQETGQTDEPNIKPFVYRRHAHSTSSGMT